MGIDKRNREVSDDTMARVLKEKAPQQRLAIVFGLWASAKKQLANYLWTEHPDWDDTAVQREVVKRLSHEIA